jgi:hypothetical protein
VKILNTLALPALLYGCETWAVKEQDKSRLTSAEIKFVRRTAKCTWQDYKPNEDILSELEIKPVVKQTQNYKNKWVQHVTRMDKDRLRHLIMKYQPCGKRRQRRALKRLINRQRDQNRSMGPKTLQAT